MAGTALPEVGWVNRARLSTICNRLMLGWVDPDWIETIDFATAGEPVDRIIRLSPLEVGEPPSHGQKAGIEIRIADGKNYYIEYRRTEVLCPGTRPRQNRSG